MSLYIADGLDVLVTSSGLGFVVAKILDPLREEHLAWLLLHDDAASILGQFHNLLGLHSFNDSSGLLVGGYGCSLTPAIFRQEIKLRVLVLSLAVDGVGKI